MKSAALAEDYAALLERWLEAGGEEPPLRATELARKAMNEGMSLIGITELHQQSLARALERPSPDGDPARTVRIATAFLVESLLPYEREQGALRESNLNLRRLNGRYEEEAKRAAHAVHAGAGQLLASAAIALERVGRELPARRRALLADVNALLDQIHGELRRLSHQLRPPMLDQLGLLPALRFLAEEVSSGSGVTVRVVGELEGRPAPAVETALYRVVQEALDNVVEHARSRTAMVRVWKEPGRVCCLVRDEGIGFEVSSPLEGGRRDGLGLAGIRERLHELGGTLRIDSAPGRGTDLVIQIPTEE